MKFMRLYTLICEKEKKRHKKKREKKEKKEKEDKVNPLTMKKDIVNSKRIKLTSGLIEIIHRNDNDIHTIEIKSLEDPNMKGEIEYDSADDAELAYKNLNTIGEILNYINVNMKKYSSAFELSDILAQEIVAMKRDLTNDEIADLKLDFKI